MPALRGRRPTSLVDQNICSQAPDGSAHAQDIFDPDNTHYLKPGKEDKDKEDKDEKGQKKAIGKTPSPFGEEPFFFTSEKVLVRARTIF